MAWLPFFCLRLPRVGFRENRKLDAFMAFWHAILHECPQQTPLQTQTTRSLRQQSSKKPPTTSIFCVWALGGYPSLSTEQKGVTP